MPLPLPTKHGDLDYVFGIDSAIVVAGIMLETLSVDAAPEFEATAKNLDGTVAAHVVGSDKRNFTASGYLTGAAPPAPGVGFTFDGKFFIIERISETHSNVDFKKLEISGKSFKLITT